MSCSMRAPAASPDRVFRPLRLLTATISSGAHTGLMAGGARAGMFRRAGESRRDYRRRRATGFQGRAVTRHRRGLAASFGTTKAPLGDSPHRPAPAPCGTPQERCAVESANRPGWCRAGRD